jgi:hypothetical protein
MGRNAECEMLNAELGVRIAELQLLTSAWRDRKKYKGIMAWRERGRKE